MLGATCPRETRWGIERTEAARARRRPTPAHRGRVEPRPACCRGGSGRPLASTRASEPRSAASRAERPSLQPPIRLDTLPRARSSEPPATRRARPRPSARGSAAARPPTPRPAGTVTARAKGPPRRPRSSWLAAVARENDRIEAALSGDVGPAWGAVRSSGRQVADNGSVRPGLGSSACRHRIGVPTGTSVHAADSGRVVMSGVVGGHGKNVCIQHTGTLSTCYAHNSRLRVREGESVDSGDVISESGCTGRCYGDHLHSEVRDRGRAVNPREYLGPLVAGHLVSGGLP